MTKGQKTIIQWKYSQKSQKGVYNKIACVREG